MKYRPFLTILLATGLLTSVSLAGSGPQDYPVKITAPATRPSQNGP